MRFVISIVAALMIIGLAAFGIVSVQKMSTARSQATASDSPATPTLQAAPTAARRHPVNPVSQVAETGAEAQLDFRLRLLDILGVGIARQILVRPSVGAKRHSGCEHLLGDLRMPSRMLADLEEGRFEAFVGQRLDHGGGIAGPRPEG